MASKRDMFRENTYIKAISTFTTSKISTPYDVSSGCLPLAMAANENIIDTLHDESQTDEYYKGFLYGSFILTWFIGLTHYFSNLTGSITSLTTWWLPFFSYFWWGFIVKKEMLKKQSKFFPLIFGKTPTI